MELGGRILELRKKAGMSQEELADRLGVSRQAVGKWENGAAIPDISNLIELSRVFGVTLGELLGLEKSAGEMESRDIGEVEKLFRQYLEEQRELLRGEGKAQEEHQQRDKKRRILSYGLMAVLFAIVIAVAIGGGRRISSLEDRLSGISIETQQSIYGISGDISSMQGTIADILQKQGSLFLDYGFEPLRYDSVNRRVYKELRVEPKALPEGAAVEFTLRDISSGQVVTVRGELDGGAFRAEAWLPDGQYSVVAAVLQGETRHTEELGTWNVSPLQLQAEYYNDARCVHSMVPSDDGESFVYGLSGYVTIMCREGEWPARGLERVVLQVKKNGREIDRMELDTDDPDNWTEGIDPAGQMDGGAGAETNAGTSVPENGLLFLSEFDLGEIYLEAGDTLTVDIEAVDAIGLVYRCRNMASWALDSEGNSSSSKSAGRLPIDEIVYGTQYVDE